MSEYLKGPLPYVQHHIKNVLSASLNKIFPDFQSKGLVYAILYCFSCYFSRDFSCVFQAGIPKAVRQLISRLAECGWLYNKIKHYVESRSSDKAFGLVGQVRSGS